MTSSNTYIRSFLKIHPKLSVDVRNVGDPPVVTLAILTPIVHPRILTGQLATDLAVIPGIVLSSRNVISGGGES